MSRVSVFFWIRIPDEFDAEVPLDLHVAGKLIFLITIACPVLPKVGRNDLRAPQSAKQKATR